MWDVAVVGGGPAGAAAARLLASWGHSVLVLTREVDRRRGLAESLPPSSRKLLAAIGALAAVEQAGFGRGIGNAVWWGDREAQLEPYGGGARGFQLFRPELDALLQQLAVDAGATVVRGATVTRVAPDGDGSHLHYGTATGARTARARFVLDASGRAGVVGRPVRRYESAFRMQALIGVWQRPGGWRLPDESYTIIETCEDGWAWSIPVAADIRHLVVMVDGTVSQVPRGRTLDATYLTALARSRQLEGLRAGATLLHTWACDASVYSSSAYAGPSHLLVGDAGACIDPLSSFGVKKALASAWVAAIAVHTAMSDAARRAAALDFFAAREREMFLAHLRQSRDYAREAFARHAHPFWGQRAAVVVPDGHDTPDEAGLARAADVQQAFARLRGAAPGPLSAGNLAYDTMPLIRGREIVLEPALRIPGVTSPMRYFAGVDLLRTADIARGGHDVPGLYEAYSHAVAPVPLPAFLHSVSLLVARGLLTMQPRPATPHV